MNKERYIAPSADIIGEVELEECSSVWYQAVLRGDHEIIHIGKRSNIQDGCVVHTDENFPVWVGNDVTVGHNAILHGCTVKDGALIGMGAIVLNGAVIGKNAIVGAGALITQGMEIPENTLAFGNPARIIRTLTKKEAAGNLESAEEYVELAKKQLIRQI
ncbi:MAG: gamma carbonic anhydrase family protein [Eubacterium sp.]|nr:gamma carbonic anhydrase family protein [Eubacterium sp.]